MLRPLVDFCVGQCAERVLNDDGNELVHAECIALHLRLVQKLRGDDDRRRAAGGFEPDPVMRTARRARPSVADRGQYDVVHRGDRHYQCRVSIL